ncbi:extracellular solute-binding protein [Geosporobacter ferrireducens]|uniref:ABC transporter substrate-binding protein n=1 Tax=Geosporobacter ferrireducens TaxID=1424294 RepID=A0A1D8GFI0_9FIRM|nr:extracellular solute-binding protein [Geosporobacter ferrireducens]AOT69667.1 ABC transporter substrate-binding protein [Geosporobacter ferrireducens]MTI54628.1 extracellular solute-binding protein [Geosporobacter ferrireducens]
MKRFISMTLALLMIFTLFTGCSPKQETPAAAPEGAASPGSGKIGTKDAPVTVTYLCKDVVPTEENVQKLVAEIEAGMAAEDNYIKLEVLEAPAGKYADVVPIAFRTGQIAPDIIYFQGGDLSIAQEGMLENLTPYINNSTHVKAIMQSHNTESIKNYPYLLWLAPARVQIPVMRSDWFNRLETGKGVLENPTPDNYYAMFKEMKDKGICEYPITTDGTIAKLDSVFNHAFGVTGTIVKVDGKYVYAKATEFEKNKLAYYAKLYKEGLLDKEYVTKQWDTMEQAFYEGKSGFVSGTAGDVVNVYNNKMIQTNGQAAELTVLPPAKGISQAYQSIDVTKESRGFAIHADSKVKDAAWAVLEYMAGAEGRKLDKLGLKDIHYTESDGKITLTEKFPEWWARFWPTMEGLNTSNITGDVLTAPAVTSLDAAAKYYHSDINVILPNELLPLKDAMDKLYIEYSTDIIRGVRNIDSFDEFVIKWNAAGGDEISAYLVEQLK